MVRLASLMTLLAAGLVGCAEIPDAELGTTEQAVIDCDEWMCGSNSPIIDTLRFHELNVNGLPNAQGFLVQSLWRGGVHFALEVDRGRIRGRSGAVTIQGPQLVGSQLRLRRGAKTYGIRITAVTTIPTFAKLGGVPRTVETYQLDVSELLGDQPLHEWRNVCSTIPARDNPDLLGMNNVHALVFEGERINAATKTISPVLDPTWFNIGCAGHAIAKLAINAQTEAARAAFGFATTILERQAFLKMVTGDYCGSGKSFTVVGQPLEWMDHHGYTKYVSPLPELQLEARWTAAGAVCLNTPRVDANPSQLGDAAFPGGVKAAVNAACGGRPPCPFGAAFLDGKLVLSSNPL